MALYKYVTASTAIRILRNRSIRFTQPNTFNDPFEFLPQFLNRNHSSWFNARIHFDLAAERRVGIEKTPTQPWVGSNSDVPAREILQELCRNVGVLCLTKTRTNLLMWAHYCADHRGAVIEFDENHPYFKNVFPVKYSEVRPIYDLDDFHEKTVPLADLYVKSKVWEYEDEVRLAKPLTQASSVMNKDSEDPKYLFEVPTESILGVTIGARMPLENKVEIWDLVKDTPMSLDIAQIANWEYALRIAPFKYSGELGISPAISPDTLDVLLASRPKELNSEA